MFRLCRRLPSSRQLFRSLTTSSVLSCSLYALAHMLCERFITLLERHPDFEMSYFSILAATSSCSVQPLLYENAGIQCGAIRFYISTSKQLASPRTGSQKEIDGERVDSPLTRLAKLQHIRYLPLLTVP